MLQSIMADIKEESSKMQGTKDSFKNLIKTLSEFVRISQNLISSNIVNFEKNIDKFNKPGEDRKLK